MGSIVRVTSEILERRVHLAATPLPSFTWKMEDRYGTDANHNGLIDLPNSRGYADPKGFAVDLDATGTQSDTPIKSYQWTFSGVGLRKPLVLKSARAMVNKVRLPQGTFNVELKVTDAANHSGVTLQRVTVRDYLIVALGDSYGAGEGNPEKPSSDPKKVKWADGVSAAMTRENFLAHRSTAAASSQAALMLEQSDPHTSVTYINLCRTGAEITDGVLGPQSHGEKSQIAELNKIVGSRPIDELVLSVGGNDFGFTSFLASLLQPGSADVTDTSTLQAQAQSALSTLSGRFVRLASALGKFSIAHTLIKAYPDPTQVSPGQFLDFATDVVQGYGISAASAKFASEDLLGPLNAEVQATATANGWEYVSGFLSDFLSHGYAADVPWFRTETEARSLQGVDASAFGLVPISEGGFHPNDLGLTDEAQSLYGVMSADLG
jgi:hypothetical protein